jgi:hypothetical protein
MCSGICSTAAMTDGHGAATRVATPPHLLGRRHIGSTVVSQLRRVARTDSDGIGDGGACLLIHGSSRARRVPDRAANHRRSRLLTGKSQAPVTCGSAGGPAACDDLLSSGSHKDAAHPRGTEKQDVDGGRPRAHARVAEGQPRVLMGRSPVAYQVRRRTLPAGTRRG